MDSCIILALSASDTQKTGASLASTLYRTPVTVLLKGDLGTGKTTFVQGFAKALGIPGHIVSPTYALEQRYQGAEYELIHIDLYRLDAREAAHVLQATEHHPGIRCIEWGERVQNDSLKAGPSIDIHCEEHGAGRRIQCQFADIPLPTLEVIEQWRKEMHLPPNIIEHCNAVAKLSKKLGEELVQRGHVVRLEALYRAALLHDLVRFVDFRPGAGPAQFKATPDDVACWEHVATTYAGKKHEAACAAFLEQNGFPEIAQIVALHGLLSPSPLRKTIEQKILYYADKRVRDATVVTLDERFDDFRTRYSDGKATEQGETWRRELKELEVELFGDRVPGNS